MAIYFTYMTQKRRPPLAVFALFVKKGQEW